MNYVKIYNDLIFRAKNRTISGYVESHHILPKCLFPEFENLRLYPENEALLTAREHYVAHQLLIKIYPNEPKLVFAANMMSVDACNGRSKNKHYEWIKRRLAKTIGPIMSARHKGTKQTLEHIRKRTAHRKGKPAKNHPNKKRVLCVETGQIFESYKAASDFVGLKSSGVIRKVANGLFPSAGGFSWRLVDHNNQIIEPEKKIKKAHPNQKAVLCIETGEVFNSISKASLKYNCDVGAVIRGTQKTAGGFHWKIIS